MRCLCVILLLIPLLFTNCNKVNETSSEKSKMTVSTDRDYINLRRNPNNNSRKRAILSDGDELQYTGKWERSWIQVITESPGYLEKGVVGWVNEKYVKAPNFQSSILGPVNDVLTDEEGGGCFMSTVEGSIMAYNIINLNGKKTLLKTKEEGDFTIYYNNKILIKTFTLDAEDSAFGSSKQIAIINYKKKEEVIFVNFSCGC